MEVKFIFERMFFMIREQKQIDIIPEVVNSNKKLTAIKVAVTLVGVAIFGAVFAEIAGGIIDWFANKTAKKE